ncbi:Poly(3-hydroxyalkanoate) polymerase subunit PhaC [Usitatibacter rugosus]|uniref:Poly(3-hydroxyalkanoate) polymerase subunit PhaC n=1 Tax=Usitatibacter rugosus TaxID=2732067 RepID=A0A6M4GYA9_9PROT|nr:class I poly(R)-hydroxyalkanoic acid synthase [Usitatibacter rugosus]QJR11494.1 Poly(3-hydroxyalkanoate) polymerase subunit PhaC [Usitatibacter rugosus]
MSPLPDPPATTPGETPTQQVMSAFAQTWGTWMESLAARPDTFAGLQRRYFEDQFRIWQQTFGHPEKPGDPPLDKRFSAPEWNQHPVFRYYRDAYLAGSKAMMESVESATLDDETKQRMRFAMKQYLDAMSPSNFLLTNPEALKEAAESGGDTLQKGYANLLADLAKGRVSMTDESAFELGKNVATTKGSVVFENELVQLIQYAPLTAQVYERPIVLVPPAINKFYIMDLQPENSLVRYLIEQGHTVFMVSWRNVKEAQGSLTWDDYIGEGILASLEAAKKITKADKVNALGFCVGGTLLASGLAVMEAKKRSIVESVTLLTTLLDFRDVGEIRVFLDQSFVDKREAQLSGGGIVPGRELASSFSFLRANDLVWSYVVNNYLRGKSPPAFDLLYWNSDSTNLPGPMYAYYIRNTYLENKLAQPDALTTCGVPVSLKRIKIPAFVFSAREDHIVPWKGGFESARCLGGPVTFVLGASGHIAGTINPASKGKRSFWSNAKLGVDPQRWLEGAKETPGSWWGTWSKWLAPYGGRKIKARKALGDARHKPIEPAPGRYVKERAE